MRGWMFPRRCRTADLEFVRQFGQVGLEDALDGEGDQADAEVLGGFNGIVAGVFG